MSKRTRGSRTSRTRPGYRPATQRPAQKAPAPKPSAAAAELDELEPVEVDVEPEAPRPAAQRPGRAGRAASQGSGRGQGLLAAKAQTEYAYVSSDLRRIGRFAAAIFGAMAVLWVLIDLTGVIRI